MGLIRLTTTSGRELQVADHTIARILEASDAAQWHGIRAIVTTTDGQTLEVRETTREIADMVTGSDS